MKKRLIGLSLLLFTQVIYPWSALGHRLIAQIAVDNLSPKAYQYFQQINAHYDDSYAATSLVAAAPWLDFIRREPEFAQLKTYHYVDLPFAIDNKKPITPEAANAIFAINTAIGTLRSTADKEEKGLALRILLHVMGDIHQPLHTITRISKRYPYGDRGGNFFHLAQKAQSLHGYWDQGGGFLKKRRSGRQLKQLAEELELFYPCSSLMVNPAVMASESHQLARDYAYSIKEGERPSQRYQRQTRSISKKQLALAGCRLALILEKIYTLRT